MPIKINETLFHIPPYLSTSWAQITSLQMVDNILIVRLEDESTCKIPGLNDEQIETIFTYYILHKEALSHKNTDLSPQKDLILEKLKSQELEPGVHFAFSAVDGLGITGVVEHDPAQSNGPDLPLEVLEKIKAITQIVAPQMDELMPQAEANCNCLYCQLARAVNPAHECIIEEHVSDKDLAFKQWNIIQESDCVYSVSNAIDTNEKYSVFLGEPLGCTCGQTGCEHIVAVLKS